MKTPCGLCAAARSLVPSLLCVSLAGAQGSLSDPLTESYLLHEPGAPDAELDEAPHDVSNDVPDGAPDSTAPPPDFHSEYTSSGGSGASRTSGAPGSVLFDLRAATPFDDFQVGGRVGFSVGKRISADFFLDLETRPYRRAVRIQESETLEYQYREERITFGPGVLARIPLGGPTAAFVAGGGAGLSPAWYRGSNREAPSTGLAWLETGFRFLTPSGKDWGLSYQFFPLPGVLPHRVSFNFGYRLKSQ
jgi:hypothetical protein